VIQGALSDMGRTPQRLGDLSFSLPKGASDKDWLPRDLETTLAPCVGGADCAD